MSLGWTVQRDRRDLTAAALVLLKKAAVAVGSTYTKHQCVHGVTLIKLHQLLAILTYNGHEILVDFASTLK